MSALSHYISVRRRYSRSINLERDLEVSDSVLGYVPTLRSIETIDRFLNSYRTPRSIRAWTITGVYGTGKSAFTHFLTALCAPNESQIRKKALAIIRKSDNGNSSVYKKIIKTIPQKGLVRAAVTAQREPIANTVIKALYRGATTYWNQGRGRTPNILKKLNQLNTKISDGEKVDSQTVLNVIKELSAASKSGILLVIDELGKCLEYAALNQNVDDLYVLQQIAELPTTEENANVFIFGLLHQSFADYAHSLTSVQRNEWAKIQGRFEDIPFVESPDQVMHLIGEAIDQTNASKILPKIGKYSKEWIGTLKHNSVFKNISSENIASVYPLHPVAAIVLPTLCYRYAQNDRTLFTFLTSAEPHSFNNFLNGFCLKDKKLPTLKLYHLYDYFVEAVGMSMSLRPQFQRWVEIQNRISDSKHLGPDTLFALQTIGILNLISTSGALRATKELVILALCDRPNDQDEISHWEKIIEILLGKSFLTYRKQVDELRIWEGTDFNIEEEIADHIQSINAPLADLLNESNPLRPIVAQRHSYKTGTVRFFESVYIDRTSKKEELYQEAKASDGLICYWVDESNALSKLPSQTEEGKPIVIVRANDIKTLRLSCLEYIALKRVESSSPQLRSDGVARNEVRQRITIAKKHLDEAIAHSFDISSTGVSCLIDGVKVKFKNRTALNSKLSDLCDTAYHKGLYLWNELINRSVLTSQGAKARRVLIEAMIQNNGQEKLALNGYGPERCMFESLLADSGIYRKIGNKWDFTIPNKKSGIHDVYHTIEEYCKSATDTPKQISSLINTLESPPYGVNQPVIPVLLLAVLQKHSEDMSIYDEGTFVTQLGPEHFELLVKKPQRYAVKYFEITGIRAKLFKELEDVIYRSKTKKKQSIRNATLLNIVKPLVRFITQLPRCTIQTTNLSHEGTAVREALRKAKEPDQLLFADLPKACRLSPLLLNTDQVKTFRTKLIQALQELQKYYDELLDQGRFLLCNAFALPGDMNKLREGLRVRANSLMGKCIEPVLKGFINAAIDEVESDKTWLEAILMIIADKPVESWSDNDIILFETKLSDLSRRFINLEAVQADMKASNLGDGFDARRITITEPNGNEIHKMVWIERENKKNVDAIANEVLENLNIDGNVYLLDAIVAALVKKVFCPKDKDKVSEKISELKEQKNG